jgi:hypothetical protein
VLSKAVNGVLVAATCMAGMLGCGGGTTQARKLFPELKQAIRQPVQSPEDNAEHSRMVQKIAEEDALYGMTRSEVEEAIGRGDPCSRHPKCAEAGFDGDDWYYTVGQMGSAKVMQRPILIVGFDRFGQVDRTWNLRTH